MEKETNEFPEESIQKETKPNNKRKVVFWSLLASGVGVIIIVALLLIFLLPKEEKYEIELSSNVSVEGEVLTGDGSYKKGESITIVAEEITGYRFTGWSFNGNIISTDKEYTFIIGEDTEGEYTANYDKLYSISVQDVHNSVSIMGNKTQAIEDEKVEFTITPNSNYRLIEVKVNNITLQAQDGKYTFTMPAENVTIVVTYIQQLKVILQSDMENADLSGANTYDIGSEVTITASAYLEDQDGNQYRFIGWQHNEEFIPVEEGGIYKFILSADTAGTYTAVYESGYKVEVEENSAQYIQIESTQAFEDDNITFTATVEDIVNDTEVIIKSIKIMANGEEIEYTNDGNQYSFTMPAGNVVISVVEETRANIIKDFVISGNSIKQYTGTDSEVVIPSTYYAYQQESDGILEFDSFDALNSYMQQELGQYQLGGGYFTYKLNDFEYSEEIKDVQAWLSEMQTHSGDSEFNLTIKLPTEYIVTEEDAVELGDGLLFSIVSPFYQLSMSTDTIISFTYQIGDGEIVSVDANNIVEIVETMGNIQPETMLPIKFTNIKYGKVIACEGDTNVITRIGDEAFANCSNLTNISIPNSITYIGGDVFRGCNNLKYNENHNGKYLGNESNPYLVLVDVIDTSVSEFSISDSCQIIYDSACSSCSNLTTINVPEGLTSIGYSAFYGCSSLTSITIPASVISISGSISGSNLNAIHYQGTVDQWANINFGSGLVDYHEGVNLYINNELLTEATITTNIKTNAFYAVRSLTKVTICEGVTSIGGSAFNACVDLEEINLPASLTSIGSGAFSTCSNLTEIHYQGTIDQWLNMTFGNSWHSGNNTNLYINNELVDEITVNTDIPSYAFYGIDSITKVTLGEGATSIGDSAFQGCTSLATVTFAEDSQLESIGDSAFQGCTSLATVTFAQDSQLESIDSYAFSNCRNLTEITLPTSLKIIGDYAFNNCSKLATVTIESYDIYKAADGTTLNQAGGLLANANTVKVLKSIDDGNNTYLSTDGGFALDDTSDPTYNIYTK